MAFRLLLSTSSMILKTTLAVRVCPILDDYDDVRRRTVRETVRYIMIDSQYLNDRSGVGMYYNFWYFYINAFSNSQFSRIQFHFGSTMKKMLISSSSVNRST